MSKQVELVSLEDLVGLDHAYRRFAAFFDYSAVSLILSAAEKDAAYKGYGVLRLFKCVLLQFMEDLSDREMERYLRENTACKWFCGFGLTESTPEYSAFSRFRSRLGTHNLSKIFGIYPYRLKSVVK